VTSFKICEEPVIYAGVRYWWKGAFHSYDMDGSTSAAITLPVDCRQVHFNKYKMWPAGIPDVELDYVDVFITLEDFKGSSKPTREHIQHEWIFQHGMASAVEQVLRVLQHRYTIDAADVAWQTDDPSNITENMLLRAAEAIRRQLLGPSKEGLAMCVFCRILVHASSECDCGNNPEMLNSHVVPRL
jgi:hypothetical protein